MKISRLPFDPGPAVWTSIVGQRQRYPKLEKKILVDFAVIGAGFAGLAAARQLQQLEPLSRIALFEARAIGEGPSGRNSGFMIDLPHNLGSKDYVSKIENDQRQIALNREAIEFSKKSVKEYQLPAEAFNLSGKVNAAATEKGLKHNSEYATHLNQMQEPYEILDEKQMFEICGSRYYIGGLATAGSGMINPGLYVHGFARGVSESGVEVFENTPIVELEKTGNVWKLKTAEGTVEAKTVILTVNGHIESFGFYHRRLMHVYLFGSMTRRLTPAEVKLLGGESSWGFTPADSSGSTVRRITGIAGDRILMRNGISWAPKRTISKSQLERAKRSHIQSFKRRFPNIADITMEYSWGGLLCLSRNAVPAFGELEPGLFSACCQNGLGVVQGTLHGKLIAEMVCGKNSPSLNRVLQFDQPKKLPPEPFLTIGGKIVTNWGEFKAGRER